MYCTYNLFLLTCMTWYMSSLFKLCVIMYCYYYMCIHVCVYIGQLHSFCNKCCVFVYVCTCIFIINQWAFTGKCKHCVHVISLLEPVGVLWVHDTHILVPGLLFRKARVHFIMSLVSFYLFVFFVAFLQTRSNFYGGLES